MFRPVYLVPLAALSLLPLPALAQAQAQAQPQAQAQEGASSQAETGQPPQRIRQVTPVSYTHLTLPTICSV